MKLFRSAEDNQNWFQILIYQYQVNPFVPVSVDVPVNCTKAVCGLNGELVRIQD